MHTNLVCLVCLNPVPLMVMGVRWSYRRQADTKTREIGMEGRKNSEGWACLQTPKSGGLRGSAPGHKLLQKAELCMHADHVGLSQLSQVLTRIANHTSFNPSATWKLESAGSNWYKAVANLATIESFLLFYSPLTELANDKGTTNWDRDYRPGPSCSCNLPTTHHAIR